MPLRSILGGLTLIAFLIVSPAVNTQDSGPNFGLPDDVAFAAQLWQALSEARLVGPRSIVAQPYEGTDPHGVILMTIDSEVNVNGREAPVIVKKNYMGEGISIESVATNPNLFLGAVTVMFRREPGYDAENQDWFWVKYKADGTLHKNPKGVQLAGRVAKNPDDACLGCHVAAPGDDYVFLHDRFAPLEAIVAARAPEELTTLSGLEPLAKQPSSTVLRQGLIPTYYFSIFNLVDEIAEVAKLEPGFVGRPTIPALDYKVGSGEVLTSGRTDGVGAVIKGLINFPEAGRYTMALESNDGVRLEIGGLRIFSDPSVHADRFLRPVSVDIETPGWYPLSVLYFEKRNTSTLRLFWTKPGDQGGLRLVPADAFAHLAG